MVDLEHETNPERLRHVARLQHAQIKHLTSMLERKDALLARLTGTPSTLSLELAAVSSRGDVAVPAPTPDRRRPARGDDKPPQRGHGPSEQPDLPKVVIECKLDEPDRMCPSCGGELSEMVGQAESSEVIDVVEVQYRVVEVRRQKYSCKCGGCVDTALTSPEAPERNIEGGRYSVRFATKVAIDKYVHHLPLERQTRMMAQHHLNVSSQALWDQLYALAMQLEPTWQALYTSLLREPVIGLDQTGWPNLEPGSAKPWQMWCVTGPGAVYHRICDDKSAATFGELLGDYRGTVVCDQAATHTAGARDGPGITLAGCWAHIYRKFKEAEPDFPAASQVLEHIGALYAVERRATTIDELGQLRRTESAAILEHIKDWLESQTVLVSTSLGKAIRHTANVWPRLRAFIEDPRIWIDNNPTERGLRGPVVGRRNHFGSKSRRGTLVASILYSLIESAKVCGVDPATYLAAAIAAARRGEILMPAAFVRLASAPSP